MSHLIGNIDVIDSLRITYHTIKSNDLDADYSFRRESGTTRVTSLGAMRKSAASLKSQGYPIELWRLPRCQRLRRTVCRKLRAWLIPIAGYTQAYKRAHDHTNMSYSHFPPSTFPLPSPLVRASPL